MFNRLKKFISLLLCAALLNACVLPSATIFAARPSITKKQAKPVAPKAEEKEDSDEENPTISESWQKVVNLEWKDLTKADGWNIVKSAGGSLFTLAVAYKIFKSTSATDTSPIIDPTNNMPGDQPTIPVTLQNIINDNQYEPEYQQKIEDICNNGYRKQLQKKGLPDLQNHLIKEIAQTSNPAPENIKNLIDLNYNVLQKHLEKKEIIKEEPTDSLSTDKAIEKKATTAITKEKEKPKSLYPFAEQAQKNNALADVTVPYQEGLLCAIHALHDGNYINEKFIQIDDDTLRENLNNLPLLSEQISQERINAHGDFNRHCQAWTSQTRRARKADANEKYISHQLHRCMTLTEEEQGTQSGFFNYILSLINGSPLHRLTPQERNSRDLIASISKEVIAQNNNPQDIVLWNDGDNIDLEELYNNILNLAHQCHRHLDDIQKANLLAFINSLDTAKLKINFNGTLMVDETRAKNHVRSYYPHLSTDFTGENLDSDELEILIEQLEKSYAFALHVDGPEDNRHPYRVIDAFNPYNPETEIYNLNGKISIIQDTARIVPNNSQEHMKAMIGNQKYQFNLLDNEDGSIIAVIKHQMSQCNQFVHTFMLRLGAVKVGSASSTHWISVTLVRFNSENHYFITDSMNTEYANKSNLQLNIKQLIDALEQPDGPQMEQAEDFDVINNEETSNNGLITDNNLLTNADNTNFNDTMRATVTQALTNALNNINKSNSKKNGMSTSKEITNTISQKKINTIRPTALIPTLEQIDNSCGYHSLKNGDDLLDILKKPEIEILDSFKDIITRIGNTLCCPKSTEKVINLFDEVNNTGTWREIIRKKRAIPVLKACIKEKLLKSVPLTENQQIAWDNELEEYKTTLNNWNNELNRWDKKLLLEFYQFYPKPEELNKPKSGNINMLIEKDFNDIAHACAKQLAENDEPIILGEKSILHDLLVNIVQNNSPSILIRENYNQCTEILNADELKNNFGDAMTIETLLKNAPNENELKTVINLSDEELQLLLISENDRTLKHADDISIITSREEPEFVSEVLPFIKAKMKSPRCLHAFIMRSGFSIAINNFCDEKNQSNNGTHWICVVLCRINNENYYIVTDSFKGDIFTAQITADVRTLIAILES